MEELDVMGLLSFLARQKKRAIAVFFSVLLVSVLLTFSWSNYKSTATVEVALPEVSPSVAESSESAAAMREALVDRQISYLQQKVLSTGSLVEIITKYDLYAGKRQQQQMADIADDMRKKIKVELLGGSFANPSVAQKVSAGQLSAIAFTVSFSYDDPALVQRVTNEIVTRFLDEDIQQKRMQAKGTTAFLETQLKTLEASLVEQEKKIAEFRAAHAGTRPDAFAFNQQVASSLLVSIQNVDAQIATNLGQAGALRAQLALLDPYSRVISDGVTLTSPSIQLRALKSEYATLTAKYGPSHPDVIKVSRQIESMLADGKSEGNDTAPLRALLRDAQTRLAALSKTGGEENPDVASLRAQVSSYEKQLKSEIAKAKPVSFVQQDADNPAYLQVVAQIRATEEQGKALASQKESLQAELTKRQEAVIQNPEVEQQLSALTRDYDNSQTRYRELKAGKLTSEMNEAIEQGRVGQRLVLIDPPELPLTTSPARALFLLAGFFAACFLSVVAVFVRQLVRPTVLGAGHFEALVGVPPLAIVPHITIPQETSNYSLNRVRRIGIVLLLVVFVLWLVSLVMPLDVLLSVLGRKLGFV